MRGKGFDAPPSLEAITPNWLTLALRSVGVLGDASVGTVRIEPLGAGAGFMSILARLRVGYDGPAPGAPATLIAKFPSRHPGAARMDAAFGHYEREFRFYREIAPTPAARAPLCHFAAFDPASRGFVLLLEDVQPAGPGDQLAGLDRDQAAAAIEAIAPLHALWWRSPALIRFDWLADRRRVTALQAACQEFWPAYAVFVGNALGEEAGRVGQGLTEKVAILQDVAAARPPTLAHGDFRADNLLLDTSPPCIVDWQLVTRAPGAFDIAYLLTSSLTPKVRRASEMELLRLYHRLLIRHGIATYEFADCLADYRLGVLIGWCWPMVGIGMLDLADARGAAMFRAWAERMSAAAVDLDLAALLA